jgi:hypothetical protein
MKVHYSISQVGASQVIEVNDGTISTDTGDLVLAPAGSTTSDKPITCTDAVTGETLVSTIATGTAPLTVASTTVVTNLNADLLDGKSETEFALLAGRSGGQVLYGGTASGNNLTLLSTSAATKGSIFFSTGSTSAFDQTNVRLGIGTAAPVYKLHIQDNVADYCAYFRNSGNNQNRYGIIIQGGESTGAFGTTRYISCRDYDGDEIGHISNTSGTFALTDPSDKRLKIDIADSKVDGLKVVNDIRVVEFRRKKAGPASHLIPAGFIAQELQKVYPEAVSEDPETGMLGVSKEGLVPVLIQAVQTLSKQVKDLQKEIIHLKKAK